MLVSEEGETRPNARELGGASWRERAGVRGGLVFDLAALPSPRRAANLNRPVVYVASKVRGPFLPPAQFLNKGSRRVFSLLRWVFSHAVVDTPPWVIMRARTVMKIVGVLLGAVIGLELLYVVAAKVALARLPKAVSYEALQLSYADAGTWFPGRVWVRDFAVRGHDYNIQFEVKAAEAQVHVDLIALLSQHFRATKVITSGVEFRMRHNVQSLAGQEKRIAAFPEIPGYDKPPVYPGPDPEPGPPEDAWIIEMTDVTAQVNEVWALEYRYVGPGKASGGFFLNPGRAFHLQPSQFVWEGGEIRVGEVTASEATLGTVNAEIHLDDISRIEGMNFLDQMRVDLTLGLQRGDLSFLEVYAGALPVRRITGRTSLDLRLITDNGRVHDGTSLGLEFDKLLLTMPDATIASTGRVQVGVRHDDAKKVLELSPFDASLRDTVFAFGGSRSKSFSARIQSNSARWLVNQPSPALQATVDVRLKPADALLDVAVGKTPAAITKALLDLPEVQSRIAVYLAKQRSRVELLMLDAGDLRASGTWQDRPKGASGGFTIETSIADIGIAIDPSGLSWDLN